MFTHEEQSFTPAPDPSDGAPSVSSRPQPASGGFGPTDAADGTSDAAAGLYAGHLDGAEDGAPLPGGLRGRFEGLLGADLSAVRLHTGAASARAADGMDAKAYTAGNDIHFGPGQDSGNLHLLAHELTHTVQQRGAAPVAQHKREISAPGDAAEVEADGAAESLVAGRPVRVAETGTATIHRSPKEGAPAAAPAKAPPGGDITAAQVTQLNTIWNRLLQKRADITKVSGAGGGVSSGVAAANPAAVGGAAGGAIGAAYVVENELQSSRQELGGLAADAHVRAHPSFARDQQTADDIEHQLDGAVSALVQQMVPARPHGAGGGPASGRLLAQFQELNQVVGNAAQLKQTAAALSGKSRQQKLDGARSLQGRLAGLEGAERSYARRALNGAAPGEVLAYLDGNTTLLDPAKAPPDVGANGGDATKDSKDPAGGPDGKVTTPDLEIGDTKIKASFDPGKGEVGVSGEGKKGSLGVGADIADDNGNLRFEGVSLSPGFKLPGDKISSKISGKLGATATKSPPTYDGTRWIVGYSVSLAAGVGLDASNGKVGVGVSGGYQRSYGGSKVFSDMEQARAFWQSGLPEISTLPDDKHDLLSTTSPGDTVTLTSDVSGGASITGGGSIQVGVGGSVGSNTDIKLTRKDGQKVVITIKEGDRQGLTGSFGTTGIGMTAGAGHADAASKTFSIDLSTPEGEAAYARWAANPEQAPPPGAGVTMVSNGQGHADSVSYGGSIAWGTGQTTNTTGESRETTADGQHQQVTFTGTQASTESSSASPFDMSKDTRSDSMEISHLDDQEPVYKITNTLDLKGSAADTNKQLAGIVYTKGDDTLEHTKKNSSGVWQVTTTYSKKQMDDFMAKVASGDVRLRANPMQEGASAADDFMATLNRPGVTDEEKQKAMARWFSREGPKAMEDLRDNVPAATRNYALDGDKYMSGEAGQAVVDGQMQDIRAKLAEPGLGPEAGKKLLMQLRTMAAGEARRNQHISDPEHYPDLPEGARMQIVGGIKANLSQAAELEILINAKLGTLGVDTRVEAGSELGVVLQGVFQARSEMVETRISANGQRRLHDGDGTLARNSAREHVGELAGGDLDYEELKEIEKRQTISGREEMQLIKGIYGQADGMWAMGETMAQQGETFQQIMTITPTFDEAGKSTAIAMAKIAQAHYKAAAQRFGEVLVRMAEASRCLLKRDDFKKQMAGNNYGHQNDFWRAME